MMTYYFYDLETSGFRARQARIMQFAGQRTDTSLKPIGEPDNFLVKLTEDVLPEPDAVLVHGITPQTARADGISEAEFARRLTRDIAKEDTVFIGFNNIRFDDEFIRFTLWRNFHDAYEWQWQGHTSRWDLLDATRMTRALRPAGIQWPFDAEGRPANRLELLAAVNKLDHTVAHDALSDVRAMIALAQLLRRQQSKLFDYLLKLRDKNKVRALVEKGDPLVYSSGRYPAEFEKTTVAVIVAPTEGNRGALMYDLRVDPTPYLKLDAAELVSRWQDRSEEAEYFPVKKLGYSRCPAVAPLSVLDADSQQRLKLDLKLVQSNLKKLRAAKDFGEKLLAALEIMQPPSQTEMVIEQSQVDELLYEGFVSRADQLKMGVVRAADAETIAKLALDFEDERLKLLFPLYKARNFAKSLTSAEREAWANFKHQKLLQGSEQGTLAGYLKRIEELAKRPNLSAHDKHLLKELELYGQALGPVE